MVDVVCVADAAGVGSERREVCARVSRWLPLAALCVFESLVWCGQEILTLRAGRGLVGVISYSRDELSSFKRVFRRAASFLRQGSLSTPGPWPCSSSPGVWRSMQHATIHSARSHRRRRGFSSALHDFHLNGCCWPQSWEWLRSNWVAGQKGKYRVVRHFARVFGLCNPFNSFMKRLGSVHAMCIGVSKRSRSVCSIGDCAHVRPEQLIIRSAQNRKQNRSS